MAKKTIELPYAVGDTIRWHCDDDGKVHTSKIQRIECEIDKHGPVFTYYVRTKWKGQTVEAGVTYGDIVFG